jgi:two-component system, sensor histidine kinase
MAPHDVLAEAVLHLTLASVVFASIPTLSRYFPLVIAYSVGVFVPLVARNVWVGGLHYQVLAVLCALGGISTLLSGRAQFHTLTEMYRRRRENATLIEALQRENKAASDARLAAEAANASKSRFFAAANHDLRQPLHAMGLLAQTLRTPNTRADVGEVAGKIVECVDNMGQVVDELQDLARLDNNTVAPQLGAFALDVLLREVVSIYQPLANAKGLAITLEVQSTIFVLTDRALLMRVLSNIVANAVRYTREGRICLRARQQAELVQVQVQDSGIGIAPEALPRIFEEFYQVGNPARDRLRGLGLGLATVKRLSDLLKLDVAVQSQVGVGSCFSLNLPRGNAAALKPDAPLAGAASDNLLHGRRILVIEDDSASSTAMALLLRSWGCVVTAVPSPEDALAAVSQGFEPAFVLADLRLPGNMDGCRATEKLREKIGLRLPALIVTGDAAVEFVCTAEDANLTVMRKPVNPMRLRAFLNDAFAER